MFKDNITLTQKAAAETATHPALPKSAVLRLRSENGTTDRANSLLGNITIAHSPTKEFGGGYRHVVRVNLRAQGDIPGAAAYFVIINNDSILGEQRAIQAFYSLLLSVVTLDPDVDVIESDVDSSGNVATFRDGSSGAVTWQQAIDTGLLSTVLPRLIGRES